MTLDEALDRLLAEEHAQWRQVKTLRGPEDLAPMIAIYDDDGRKVAFAQGDCERDALISGLGAVASTHRPLIVNGDAAGRDFHPDNAQDRADLQWHRHGDTVRALRSGDSRAYEMLTSHLWWKGVGALLSTRYTTTSDGVAVRFDDPERTTPLDGDFMNALTVGHQIGVAHGPVPLETAMAALHLLGFNLYRVGA